jgi:hypothetical protein
MLQLLHLVELANQMVVEVEVVPPLKVLVLKVKLEPEVAQQLIQALAMVTEAVVEEILKKPLEMVVIDIFLFHTNLKDSF